MSGPAATITRVWLSLIWAIIGTGIAAPLVGQTCAPVTWRGGETLVGVIAGTFERKGMVGICTEVPVSESVRLGAHGSGERRGSRYAVGFRIGLPNLQIAPGVVAQLGLFHAKSEREHTSIGLIERRTTGLSVAAEYLPFRWQTGIAAAGVYLIGGGMAAIQREHGADFDARSDWGDGFIAAGFVTSYGRLILNGMASTKTRAGFTGPQYTATVSVVLGSGAQ